jgi:hypothetical protein
MGDKAAKQPKPPRLRHGPSKRLRAWAAFLWEQVDRFVETRERWHQSTSTQKAHPWRWMAAGFGTTTAIIVHVLGGGHLF